MAAILAKQGVSVVMIDAETHPHFAIGESTIPHTSLLLSLLAERYGVPELEDLTYPDRVAKHITTTCGIKRAFGFAYHRPGEEYDPRDGFQMGTNLKDENHFFRQDVDSYLFYLAVHYGAAQRQRTKVVALNIDQQGVTLKTDSGEEIHAKYVVDGTGYKSVLAQMYDLREKPTRFKHHSRSLFTHMVDVGRFEEKDNPLSLPWQQTTLHHVFDRGWFWVIPFNNHSLSTNPLISVGLTIDERRYPKTNQSPEEEFRQFLERHPSVAKQFVNARVVRPWVSTDRLQYSSKPRTVGYRYCMMSHAAGAIDPLYSRGLINTFEVVYALLDPLLNALKNDDFSMEGFAHIEKVQQRVLDFNDRLVNSSYISWADFELWNAWVRVWAIGSFLAEYNLMKALSDYTATRDLDCLKGEVEDPLFSNFENADYAEFFTKSEHEVEAFERGEVSSTDAAKRIFGFMNEYEFLMPIHVEAMRRAGWVTPERGISERNLESLRQGYRWALANPTSRDLFGTITTFYRWRDRLPDPHLANSQVAVQP